MPGKWSDPPIAVNQRTQRDDMRPSLPAAERPTNESNLASFIVEQPKRSLLDLVVSRTVMARIERAIDLTLHRDLLFETWNLKSIAPNRAGSAVNMYGPPGTGKTLCAEAIAHQLSKGIVTVNYAEIESRYVGQTPKNIVEAFRVASEGDAVLFFDEADSVLGKRLTNVTQSTDTSVNVTRSVMLMQLDRFVGTVLFATNLAANYDPAFVRRIHTHIAFDLPDVSTLERLWERILVPELPVAPDVTPTSLAPKTVGLAGGDLVNVVIASAASAASSGSRVSLEVLHAEIEHVRRAKHDVGADVVGRPRHGGVRLVSSEMVALDGADIASDNGTWTGE